MIVFYQEFLEECHLREWLLQGFIGRCMSRNIERIASCYFTPEIKKPSLKKPNYWTKCSIEQIVLLKESVGHTHFNFVGRTVNSFIPVIIRRCVIDINDLEKKIEAKRGERREDLLLVYEKCAMVTVKDSRWLTHHDEKAACASCPSAGRAKRRAAQPTRRFPIIHNMLCKCLNKLPFPHLLWLSPEKCSANCADNYCTFKVVFSASVPSAPIVRWSIPIKTLSPGWSRHFLCPTPL